MKAILFFLFLIQLGSYSFGQTDKDSFNICNSGDTNLPFEIFKSYGVDSMVALYLNESKHYVIIFKLDDRVFLQDYYLTDKTGSDSISKFVISGKKLKFNFREFYTTVFNPSRKYVVVDEDDTGDFYFTFKLGNQYYSRCFMHISARKQILNNAKYRFLYELCTTPLETRPYFKYKNLN